MKLYYFYTLTALWDSQGKIKMYYGISMVQKQLSGKRVISAKSKVPFWRYSVTKWPIVDSSIPCFSLLNVNLFLYLSFDTDSRKSTSRKFCRPCAKSFDVIFQNYIMATKACKCQRSKCSKLRGTFKSSICFNLKHICKNLTHFIYKL